MSKPDIGRKTRFLSQLGSPGRNIAITFGVEKQEWCGYSGENFLKICLFVSTEYTNVTDEATDGDA